MVNDKCYTWFEEMKVDEDREIIDLSDHNIISVTMKPKNMRNIINYNGAEEETVEYYKMNDETLQVLSEVCKRAKELEKLTMEKLNKTMQDVADEKLKARYVRRVVDSPEKITEPPWVTKQIRKEIKKRKGLNRRRRNAETQEESNVLLQSI